MSSLRNALRSSVGSKTLMALTGLALLGFVLGHLVGNLQIFAGQEKLNAYAQMLKDSGPLLWGARIGLVVVFVMHIATAIRLTLANRAARPDAYVVQVNQRTTYAARTMLMSGLIVLAFVIFHLLHFTLGVTHPEFAAEGMVDSAGRHDVAKMVVLGFQSIPVSCAYVVAQLLLGLHLMHGVSSLFQSLGVQHPQLAFLERGAGRAVAAVVVIGNCSIPLAILAGFVPEGVVL